MKITLKCTMKARVKPSLMGFMNILLGNPINIYVDLKDVPVVFNHKNGLIKTTDKIKNIEVNA